MDLIWKSQLKRILWNKELASLRDSIMFVWSFTDFQRPWWWWQASTNYETVVFQDSKAIMGRKKNENQMKWNHILWKQSCQFIFQCNKLVDDSLCRRYQCTFSRLFRLSITFTVKRWWMQYSLLLCRTLRHGWCCCCCYCCFTHRFYERSYHVTEWLIMMLYKFVLFE